MLCVGTGTATWREDSSLALVFHQGSALVQSPPFPIYSPSSSLPPATTKLAPGMPRAADSLINSRLCGAGGCEDGAGHALASAPTRAPPPRSVCAPVSVCARSRAVPLRGVGKLGARGSACLWRQGIPGVCVAVVCPWLGSVCICLSTLPRLCSGCSGYAVCAFVGCVCVHVLQSLPASYTVTPLSCSYTPGAPGSCPWHVPAGAPGRGAVA